VQVSEEAVSVVPEHMVDALQQPLSVVLGQERAGRSVEVMVFVVLRRTVRRPLALIQRFVWKKITKMKCNFCLFSEICSV
jgi:hypothetical protein